MKRQQGMWKKEMEKYSNEDNILTAVEKNNKTYPVKTNHISNMGSKLKVSPENRENVQLEKQ